MNGNRGQYNSAPLYNMKKKRRTPPPVKAEETAAAAAEPGQTPAKRRYFALSLIVCIGLPVLFLTALIVPNNMLRWVFLVAVLLTVLAMWALQAFAKSARGTLTVIYGALALVIGLALFMNSQSPETRNVSSPLQNQPSLSVSDQPSAFGLNTAATPKPEENPNAAAAAAAVSAAQQQLEGFLSAWAVGDVPQMLEFVLPSWKAQQTSPETALWMLTQDSRPTNYLIERVMGSDGDTTRTIVTRVTLNERNTGAEPVTKRMQVLVFRIGQNWYVDPQSLNGTTVNLAAEEAQEVKPMIATTIAPTGTPAPQTATSSIKVYYNPDGGKYYHNSSICDAVNEKWWPLTEISYDQLNSAQFSKLQPCPQCNPPQRSY